MIQLEFNFNERKGQMAVEWLIEQLTQLDKQLDGRRKSDDSTVIKLNPTKIYEQAKAIEEQRIKDAIMYALDEDGHTGDWKIKFANDYIKNLKQTK